ncbi:MAG: 3-dehydroquinate synthase family protein, partial [Tepidisphaeraceae bacterium]
RNGLAECIKHDVIRDADGFASLEQNIGRAIEFDLEYLTDLIAHNVAIKGALVASDPFEQADRALLNFGHTFGHGIETAAKFTRPHGECVALGMIAASRAAVAMNMLDEQSRLRIVGLIDKAQLATRMFVDSSAVIEAMAYDKKVRSGKLRLVLPDRIGHVVLRDDVPPEVVRGAVESLRG